MSDVRRLPGVAYENAESVTDKVFDIDNNPVSARLLVWGPTEVDGEVCVIAEPTDFFSTAPNPEYGMDEHATLAADDLRVAIPVRLVDVGKLTCRTMGEDLHMSRGEAQALLAHLREEPAVIRRRLEVLLGEKTLGQVDDEAERERNEDPGDPDHCPKCRSQAIARIFEPDADWVCLDCKAKFFADDPDEV